MTRVKYQFRWGNEDFEFPVEPQILENSDCPVSSKAVAAGFARLSNLQDYTVTSGLSTNKSEWNNLKMDTTSLVTVGALITFLLNTGLISTT
jgi:hypothetical protein